MPLIETKGAASAQGFGEFAASSGAVTYIEDVFSTWLYTGTGAAQSVVNNIDLSTKGGLVWVKSRAGASGTSDHILVDTARGISSGLKSNTTGAASGSGGFTAFNVNGFSFDSAFGIRNDASTTYASWTFRKQPKFFDVVTYTGNGASGRAISHSLASVPGCMIVKRTNTTGDWAVYQRATSATPWHDVGFLNLTDAWYIGSGQGDPYWAGIAPTSTNFYVDTALNNNGDTYVAYLFAHNAGGFGLTGTDNVISCGSFTGNGSATGPVINLGYEPQWVLIKNASGPYNWILFDNMRGMPVDTADKYLFPNDSADEKSFKLLSTQATGFQLNGTLGITNANGDSYIYIAIRRGPMKVPTSGTSVFSPATSSATAGTPITTGFPIDLQIATERVGSTNNIFYDRLRGVSTTTTQSAQSLISNTNGAENSPTTAVRNWGSTGFEIDSRHASSSTVYENFRRAPSFFDEVCYTGDDNVGRTVNHNLGVVPELMIFKSRNNVVSWTVYAAAIGPTKALILDSTNASANTANFNSTAPTASVFTLGGFTGTNAATYTYVAYLFATCAGVSKVGSYTGTGATQTISCGFTGGARFVMIKRTDSTGNWYYWDTARGMVSGTDPKLALNSDTAESNADWVYTATGGFQIVTTDANVNASGGTYIFLAIA